MVVAMARLRIEVVGPTTLLVLEAALAAVGLPTADLREPGRLFLRFDNERLVGFGGIEGDDPDQPRYSIRVDRVRAATLGTARLHLLATTAAPFLRRRGYVAADRESAPPWSRAPPSLCPASAT